MQFSIVLVIKDISFREQLAELPTILDMQFFTNTTSAYVALVGQGWWEATEVAFWNTWRS